MAEENTINQEFPLAFNSYAAFDATSLKSLMQQRLIQGGVFTDQIFEGSNFNSLLDIIAYSYHVLLFYLNKTANEASFSNAQLYENVNRIVKLLNYNPIGVQTCVLSFSATASENIPVGIYTIPKYSYFKINDINYSFTEDLTFAKTISGTEVLNDLNENALIYQGFFVEYPIYVATGESFEEFNIVSVDSEGNNDLIDHNHIHVYVKSGNNPWKEYKPINSLYLESGLSESYELRLNENLRYTIKFGNDVTGKKLNSGDFVAVYFLKSDGTLGEIGANSLNGNVFFTYNSALYNEIMRDVRPSGGINILNLNQIIGMNFSNNLPSSKFTFQEDSLSIKNNAKNTYKSQYRLINSSDFENYIFKNFSNLVQDVKVVNNTQYVEEHLQYLNEIGLSEPNLDSRILFNQINFASSCNFNNVYVYCIPKVPQNENFKYNKFLNMGLKNIIKEKIDSLKILTSEVVFQDPVYVSVGLGVATAEEINLKKLYPEIISETYLRIVKNKTSYVSDSSIKENIINVFKAYFENEKLGITIDLQKLNASLFLINGIETFSTERKVNDQLISLNGLGFMVYNPIYYTQNEDIRIITQSLKLPFFKAAYYENYDSLLNNIIIE
jgi:hypothetical protein